MITGVERNFNDDKRSVFWFSNEMSKKLYENRIKKHWSHVDCDYLFDRLMDEVRELSDARSGTSEEIIAECADVANFAMMIADNVRCGIK